MVCAARARGNDANDCRRRPAACATITVAIGKARRNDTISLAAGSYSENLTISKNITIIGAGPGATSLDGGNIGTVVTIRDFHHCRY